MVNFDFSDKIALVTGGSSGLGFATAKAFAESGATVVIASRNPQKAQQALSSIRGNVEYIQTDLEQMADVCYLFEQIEARFNRLDIAVNCAAGEGGIGKPLIDFTEAEFDSTFNINLKSMWLCMKYEIELMQKAPDAEAHIVNVSSVNGLGGCGIRIVVCSQQSGRYRLV